MEEMICPINLIIKILTILRNEAIYLKYINYGTSKQSKGKIYLFIKKL